MVKKRTLAIVMLMAATYAIAADKKYYEFPNIDNLKPTSRILVYDPFSGSRNISGSVIQTQISAARARHSFPNISTNAIYFNTNPPTTPTPVGSLFWDAQNKTLAFHTSSDTTVQIGQEIVVYVRNNSGASIPDGAVVRLSGAQGVFPTINLADATTELNSYPIGLATQTIPNNSFGFVTTFGTVNNVNTTNYTEGALLYLSTTPGQLTMTRPLAPLHGVPVARALNSKVQGSLFVSVQLIPELSELHDVLINTPLTDQFLVYAADGTWKNTRGVTAAKFTNNSTYTFAQISTIQSLMPTVCTGSNPIKDGAEGAPGPRGEAGQIVSVSASTLPHGLPPTVTNNGSLSQAQLVFGLPAGGADALFCNLSGGTRSITYDANGANPLPTMTEFVVQVWRGAQRVLADAWVWWTGGNSERVYGSATTATFTPSVKSVFSHRSSHNYIAVQARYSSSDGKQYCIAGTPIAITKIGSTGADGAPGSGGGSAPGGNLNAIQYKYSSASTKKIFRGFGRFSAIGASGAGTLIL